MTQAASPFNKLTEEEIDKCIETLDNPKTETDIDITAEDLSEIKFTDNQKIQQDFLNVFDLKENKDENINRNEKLNAMAKEIAKLSSDKRNELLRNLAKLSRINPSEKEFSTMNDNKKQFLKKKFHERKMQLKLQRSSRICKDNVLEKCKEEINKESEKPNQEDNQQENSEKEKNKKKNRKKRGKNKN